jgi:hypothetical protein
MTASKDYCKDCRHHDLASGVYVCRKPELITYDLVTGAIESNTCYRIRLRYPVCLHFTPLER